MGVPDYFTCLLRNLCVGQKATVRTVHETKTGSILGKEYVKTAYCHSSYFTYMQRIVCGMLGWINHKLESRLPGEISANSDMQMMAYLPSNSRKQRGTKEPLDEDERRE